MAGRSWFNGESGGRIGIGKLRCWQVWISIIAIDTELTIAVMVINGVQKAFQRSRRRSSLISSSVFGGSSFTGGF